jgi:hypothetical protein
MQPLLRKSLFSILQDLTMFRIFMPLRLYKATLILSCFNPHIFHFRESTLSDLAPSLVICLYVYISMCTPPPISPLYHTVLKTGGKSEY